MGQSGACINKHTALAGKAQCDPCSVAAHAFSDQIPCFGTTNIWVLHNHAMHNILAYARCDSVLSEPLEFETEQLNSVPNKNMVSRL